MDRFKVIPFPQYDATFRATILTEKDNILITRVNSVVIARHLVELHNKQVEDGLPIDWDIVMVCDNCKSDYDVEHNICISCGKSNPLKEV